MVKSAIDPEEAKHIRQKYSPIPQNDDERTMESIELIMRKHLAEGTGQNILLEGMALLIYRRLEFKEVAIGLKDPDGKFRYKIMQGFTSASEEERRKIAYTESDMRADSEKFPSIPIGCSSEFLNGETLPEEFGIYSRPSQLIKKRESVDDFKEGDYIDTFLFGNNREMVGWIEVSGTRNGKLPERSVLNWLELIGMLIGLVIAEEENRLGFIKKE